MPYDERAIQKVDIRIPERAAKAIRAAYKQALNAGQVVLVVSDGKLVRISPDFKREVVRNLPKRISVTKGQKIKLR